MTAAIYESWRKFDFKFEMHMLLTFRFHHQPCRSPSCQGLNHSFFYRFFATAYLCHTSYFDLERRVKC